jgi:N-acetylated-alpha-linked acidic dipeptidase
MVGRMIMRLANAEVLPFDFTDTADAIAQYVDELVALDGEGRLQELLRAIGAANAQLRVAAVRANVELARVLAGGEAWTDANAQSIAEVNRLIMQAERELLDERGVWRRPWYRNLVYAPGYYEGYAAKTLPGVREAMEEGEWEVARSQAGMLIEALGRATTVVTGAGEAARRAVPGSRP